MTLRDYRSALDGRAFRIAERSNFEQPCQVGSRGASRHRAVMQLTRFAASSCGRIADSICMGYIR
ncbi:MAG: hypothetical protein E6699_22095, partial [Bradyrhizobium sp.]|uniref:hypothetical protein n=1 Tax=Bradyrhizobium sp. TaxID=376 RepID=UPI0029026D76